MSPLRIAASAWLLLPASLPAGVFINEFQAAPNEILLDYDAHGTPRPGYGPAWFDPEFDSTAWLTGPAPIGHGGTGLGSDTGPAMAGKTPSLYLRKTFTLTAAEAANSAALTLRVLYDDGFVARVNGRETGRANLGPPLQYIFHDQSSTRSATGDPQPAILTAAPAGAALVAGVNVLTLQVHNHNLTGPCRIDASLSAGSREVFPFASPWQYFVGRLEPSGGLCDPAELNDPLYDGDLRDWVELHNDGPQPVSLENWSLTDNPRLPRRWTFPPGTSIPAGGYLLVICDSSTAALPGAQYLRAGFDLAADDGHLSLRQPDGKVASEISGYTRQSAFHTWGRNPAGGADSYGYLRHGTPGRANRGPFFPKRARTPDFEPSGGFYTGSQTVTIASETGGATVRYTTDGSDPDESSTLYTGPITLHATGLDRGPCLRAKAWKSGAIPSEIKTATYLIDQDARLCTAPVLAITGDPQRALFKPFGVMAIGGGAWDQNGLWAPSGIADYNNALAGELDTPLLSGRPWERPVSVEWRYADGRSGFNEIAGLRISGSGHSRPRYVFSGVQQAPWSFTDFREKPSFNIFFRNEYGKPEVSQQLFPPGYPVERFARLRVRAGKNDVADPFVKDEFMRRLCIAMGRPGARGVFNSLYVNGTFRGIYNTTERLREPFMRQHFNSTASWDVRQVNEIADGDGTAFDAFLALLDASGEDPASQEKYEAAAAQLEVPAFIDYILANVWGATGDWPHSNYVASRERSPTGVWRWFAWDAEGSFGGFGKHRGYNVFTGDLLANPSAPGREICRTWDRLSKNAGFRLQVADRIHLHFCNGGALTDSRLTALKDSVTAEYLPLFQYLFPGRKPDESWFTTWVHPSALDRRDALFHSAVFDDPDTPSVNDPREFGYQFSQAGVWPAADGHGPWQAPLPPKLNQHGGDIPAGWQLTLLHTEPFASPAADEPYQTAADQHPAARSIYYTLDGSDPRRPDGTPGSTAAVWTQPVALTAASAVRVQARIRDTATGEWSPLTAALFRAGAVPPSAASLVIAEIMYHPQKPGEAEAPYTDREDFEFIRVLNTGPLPVKLSEARFTTGISFEFSEGSVPVLDPGQSALVVSKLAAFRARYGSSLDALIAGEFTGTNLSNGGEQLRLETVTGVTLHDFTYDDEAPWPQSPDGSGPSLILRDPASAPDHREASSWTASARPGGLTIPAAPPLDFTKWRLLSWSPAETEEPGTEAHEDPDGDDLTNFAEYALGTHPRVPGSAPVTVSAVEGPDGPLAVIAFRTLSGSSGVVIEAQASTDLTNWSAAPALGAPVFHPDGTLTHRHGVPVPPGGRVFLRVKFTAP